MVHVNGGLAFIAASTWDRIESMMLQASGPGMA